ncbi:MAG: TlpA family protein disulfide reductase [Flavobacteriaceae bacterium]|nr:TlpA family protein disulfide reductase [Flavobacteriaceae bacterium]
MNQIRLFQLRKEVLLMLFIVDSTSSFGQISIVEVKAIYKSKIDGRIISEKEFQTYRGTHTFHKLIKGKNGRDTIVISPPKAKLRKKIANNKQKLIELKGKTIKPFNVNDIYGNSYSSESLKGKVVVMNFWFIACTPCVQEIPDLNEVVEKYLDRDDVVFLAFAKDTESLLGKFLAHTQFEYNIIPRATSISKLYNVYAYPTHIVVDKKGMIQSTEVGYKSDMANQLINTIDKLIK